MDKRDRPYTVEKYNPRWSDIFEKEKGVIQNIFSSEVLRIDHVGSTSVPGMWAKPQIDIMVVVDNLDIISQFVEEMQNVGYRYEEDYIPNAGYFYKDAPTGERLVTIQVFETDNPDIKKKLCFRDYLINHPEEAKLYSQIKIDAYDGGNSNRVEYSKKKRPGLMKILSRAESWCQNNV